MFTKLMKIFTMMCWWQVHVPIQVGYIYKWFWSLERRVLQIIRSCQGTLPAGLLHQCLIVLRTFFPSLLEALWPCTFNVSSILLPSRHAPSTWLPLRSSLSTKVFCTLGYLILIRLWRTQHVLIISWAVDGRCPMIERRICKGKHVHIQ